MCKAMFHLLQQMSYFIWQNVEEKRENSQYPTLIMALILEKLKD